MRVCEHPAEPTADQKDVLLRFGAIVKTTLAEFPATTTSP